MNMKKRRHEQQAAQAAAHQQQGGRQQQRQRTDGACCAAVALWCGMGPAGPPCPWQLAPRALGSLHLWAYVDNPCHGPVLQGSTAGRSTGTARLCSTAAIRSTGRPTAACRRRSSHTWGRGQWDQAGGVRRLQVGRPVGAAPFWCRPGSRPRTLAASSPGRRPTSCRACSPVGAIRRRGGMAAAWGSTRPTSSTAGSRVAGTGGSSSHMGGTAGRRPHSSHSSRHSRTGWPSGASVWESGAGSAALFLFRVCVQATNFLRSLCLHATVEQVVGRQAGWTDLEMLLTL